jgi:hypothetical protein
MPGKRFGGWGLLLALSTSSGCCWWCDRWCPPRQTTCAPVCCATPTYAAAPAYSTPPPPIPAAPVQSQWQNAGAARPPLYYNPGTNCYCEQGR